MDVVCLGAAEDTSPDLSLGEKRRRRCRGGESVGVLAVRSFTDEYFLGKCASGLMF